MFQLLKHVQKNLSLLIPSYKPWKKVSQWIGRTSDENMNTCFEALIPILPRVLGKILKK